MRATAYKVGSRQIESLTVLCFLSWGKIKVVILASERLHRYTIISQVVTKDRNMEHKFQNSSGENLNKIKITNEKEGQKEVKYNVQNDGKCKYIGNCIKSKWISVPNKDKNTGMGFKKLTTYNYIYNI